MLEAGLLHGTGAEDLAQLVEPDLFANVELDQDENRTVQRRLDRRPQSCGAVSGRVKNDFGV